MRAKLRGLFYAALFVAIEAALLFPANLLDRWIDGQLTPYFAANSGMAWGAQIAIWSLIVVVPLVVFAVGYRWLAHRRRAAHLKESFADLMGPTTVRVIGTKEWRNFQADAAVRLVVPDAIAAIDRANGLLRLKAIGSHHDNAIDLGHVISAEQQRAESRVTRGRQALFRRYNPKFRTLSELPRIRLEIMTDGRDPILEYFLFTEVNDGKALAALFSILKPMTRRGRGTDVASTVRMLESLPPQGSSCGFRWIEDTGGQNETRA